MYCYHLRANRTKKFKNFSRKKIDADKVPANPTFEGEKGLLCPILSFQVLSFPFLSRLYFQFPTPLSFLSLMLSISNEALQDKEVKESKRWSCRAQIYKNPIERSRKPFKRNSTKN